MEKVHTHAHKYLLTITVFSFIARTSLILSMNDSHSSDVSIDMDSLQNDRHQMQLLEEQVLRTTMADVLLIKTVSSLGYLYTRTL